jgi:hypothetical protein
MVTEHEKLTYRFRRMHTPEMINQNRKTCMIRTRIEND